MGTVWRARHAGQGLPVAIKVLEGLAASRERAVRAFRDEVRAVARLHHPAIVRVYDHGRAPQGIPDLFPGNPWLAMELVDAGTLGDWRGRLSWVRLRRVLLALLDALAHAHARGVVHRDLKPANVLLSGQDQVKLTDFGLAHALGRSQGDQGIAGTPTHMAPEQFQARWRDFGPWTDLYALGCLTWELATGSPPFRGIEFDDQRRAHLHYDLPQFAPRLAMPHGLGEWLLRLLQKRPEARFQRAADAAWALLDLPETIQGVPLQVTGPSLAPTQPTFHPNLAALTWISGPGTLVPDDEAFSVEELPEPDGGVLRACPPLPAAWRRPDVETRMLSGVGLGLVRLRELPLVGRDDALDALWRALVRVRSTQSPEAIVLRGPAGIGKTRLAEWILERGHELGAAATFTARHNPSTADSDGLGSMIARHLGALGLQQQALAEHLDRHAASRDLPELERRALTERITPNDETLREQERHAVVARLLKRARQEGLEEGQRVLLLLLDDVVWGPEAVAFTKWLLSRSGALRLPALVLLTVREDALADHPDMAAAVTQLLETPGAQEMRLDPLAHDARRILVQGLLGLSGDLAAEIQQRSGGNPLFAEELVGDLVDRGVLEHGDQGFELAPGQRVELPADLYRAWGSRLDALLHAQPHAVHVLLEIAATLGAQVHPDEWADVARVVLGEPTGRRRLEELLIRRRLARRLPEGLLFAHGMLREAVVRRARDAGRHQGHHAACFQVLEARGEIRRALVHASEAELHADVLRLSAPLIHRGFHVTNLPLMRLVVRLGRVSVQGLELPDTDRRVLELDLGQSFLVRQEARFSDMREFGPALLARTEQAGELDLQARVLRDMAEVDRQQGHGARAMEGFQRALEVSEAAGDLEMQALCWGGLADVRRQRFEHEPARVAYKRARALQLQLGNALGVAGVERGLGGVARNKGDLAGSRKHLERALASFYQGGTRLGMANVHNDLGDLDRFSGDLERAEVEYLAAERLFSDCGSYAWMYPRFNVCLIHLAQGQFGVAAPELLRLDHETDALGLRGLQTSVVICRVACACADRDWPAAATLLDRVAALIQETGDLDHDNAWPAELAATLAHRSGRVALTARCAALAVQQYEGIGAQAEADRVRERLGVAP